MGMLSFTPMVLFPGLLHDLRGYPDAAIGLLLAVARLRQLGVVLDHRADDASLSAH